MKSKFFVSTAAIFFQAAIIHAEVQWVDAPKRRPLGVEHRVLQSTAMRRGVGYNIYLPPGYAEQTGKRFPVVYHLSGMGDTESTELNGVPLIDAAIRKNALAPMIVVFVNGGGISFYADSPSARILAETLVIRELLPEIDKQFRTIPAREGRGLQGFSMGGFGALKLAFKYPDLFGSVVAYTAGLYDGSMMKQKLGKVLKPMFGNDPRKFDQEAPARWLKENREKISGRTAIRLAVGSKEMLLELCRRMHQLLNEERIPHDYEEIRGVGHKPEEMTDRDGIKGFQFHAQSFAKALSKESGSQPTKRSAQ